MDRRQMFGGMVGTVLGWFGVKTAAAAAPATTGPKGIVVFKINCGRIPAFKAEAFVSRLKEQFLKKSEERNLKGWDFFFQPIRPCYSEQSQVQIFVLNGGKKEEVEPVIMDFSKVIKDACGFDLNFRENLHDYITVMLGAPVVAVELDTNQIDMCIDHTMEAMDLYAKSTGGINSLPIRGIDILKRGALAHAKMILGRVRSASNNMPGNSVYLDGQTLIEEGREELDDFYEELKEL